MPRFVRRVKGVKVLFCPAIANKAAPTRAELTGGTDLTPDLYDLGGFILTPGDADASDFSSAVEKTVPGLESLEASTLTFHDDDVSSTIRTALAKGTNGYVVRFPYGDVATRRCEVWPVRSKGPNDEWNRGSETAKFPVGFSITDTPALNAVTPA